MASASVSLTTRTGRFSSSAIRAARRRRAPATTSYLLSSSSRTSRGARMPCVLKLAASSSNAIGSNRFRGFVPDSTKAAIEMLRYSLLVTALCVACMTSSPLIRLYFWLGWSAHTLRVCAGISAGLRLCGCGRRRRLGSNAPENHGSGLLDGFQALAQKTGVSVPEGYVIRRATSGLKPYGLTNNEGHSFGLGF